MERIVAVRHPSGKGPMSITAIEEIPRLSSALGWDDRPHIYSAALSGEDAPQAASTALDIAMGQPRAEAPLDDPLSSFLADWLRFYGPMSPATLSDILGVSPKRVAVALSLLLEEKLVVIDTLTAEAPEKEVCHVDNLRRLLPAEDSKS